MQATQMATCLREVAPLLDGEARNGLLTIADGLEGLGTKKVDAVAKKLKEALSNAGAYAAGTPQQTDLLGMMSRVATAAGNAAIATDFAVITEVLSLVGGSDKAAIDALFTRAFTKPSRAPRTARAVQREPIDARAVADQLTAAAQDNARFDELVLLISKHAKDDLAAIAAGYLGYSSSYKSKPAILKAIRARQAQDFMDQQRSEKAAVLPV